MTTPLAAGARPDTLSAAYTRMKPRWDLVRDVRGGTRVLRVKKTTYLPRFEAEDLRDWSARVKLTTAYDAVDQTLAALVGLAFMTAPELAEDVPAPIRLAWEDIDGEGTHGDVFAGEVLDAALQDGHCGILTEFPELASELRADEKAAFAVRPYLVRVPADQILSCRVGTFGGRRILMQLVLKFVTEVEDGAFGMRDRTEYWVYRQRFDPRGQPFATWELWAEAPKTRALGIVTEETVIRGPKVIPFAVCFGGQRIGFPESSPPLEGLAYSNVDHTQVKSDRRYSLHVCGSPVAVAIGRSDTKSPLVLSSTRALDVGIGGDVKIVEAQGTALEQMRLELQDIERRMGEQGLSLVLPQDGAAKTAAEVHFTSTRQESKLARAVRSEQDALERSFQFMAAYEGLTMEAGGSIILRRDFTALTLSDADMAAITSARERGDLTLETFLNFLRLRGGLFETLDAETEAEAVKTEMGEEPGLTDTDPETPTIELTAEPATTPAADVILNGAQITAAKDIVIAVTAGELPRDTGVGMLEVFFRLSPAQADGMMGSAGTNTPTTPNPNPTEPVQAAPVAPEPVGVAA